MTTHLRYNMMTATLNCNENRHPQVVMRALGITYQHATPQSIADQWWFWNCKNAPDPLPEYLSELRVRPTEAIGYGLTSAEAQAIESDHRIAAPQNDTKT